MLPCKGQCSEFQRHSPTSYTCVYTDENCQKPPLPLKKKKNVHQTIKGESEDYT